MYAFDPAFQIEESYTWVYNTFRTITVAIVFVILIFVISNVYKVWLKWPLLIQRHKVCFIFSLYFIFTFGVCKPPS